jgi:translocator protein
MSPVIRVVVAILASYGAGLAGYLFVDAGVSSWYAGLVKPVLLPSASTLAIIWLILYGMMAAALAVVWTKKPRAEHTEGWVRFFFLQLLFNASYTMFFFGFHAILIAFIDVLMLGFIVISLTASAEDIDRRVVYLMIPYLLWIVFAGYLTLSVWFLN